MTNWSWFAQDFPSFRAESPLSGESLQFWANWNGGSPSAPLRHPGALGDHISGTSCHPRGVGGGGLKVLLTRGSPQATSPPCFLPSLPLPDPLKLLWFLEGKGLEDGLSPSSLYPPACTASLSRGAGHRGCLRATERDKHSARGRRNGFSPSKSLQMAQT